MIRSLNLGQWGCFGEYPAYLVMLKVSSRGKTSHVGLLIQHTSLVASTLRKIPLIMSVTSTYGT